MCAISSRIVSSGYSRNISRCVSQQTSYWVRVHWLVVNLFEKLFSFFSSMYVQKNSPMRNLDPIVQEKKRIILEMRLLLAHVQPSVPERCILDLFSKIPHFEQQVIYNSLWVAHGGELGLLARHPLNIDNNFGERFMQSHPAHDSVVDSLRMRVNVLESEIRSANFF